jgi:LPS sulfotransferase NodH
LGDITVIAPEAARARIAGLAPRVVWRPTVEAAQAAEAQRVLVMVESWQEEKAIVRRLHGGTPHIYGLYGRLLPALVARRQEGARFHARVPAGRRPVSLRYAIVCPGRVGSGYLCALLAKAGLGAPWEHARDVAVISAQAGMPVATFLQRVEPYGVRAELFGTKLVIGYFSQACLCQMERAEAAIAALAERGYLFFTLTRNALDAGISAALARASNAWHLHPGEIEQLAERHSHVELDEVQLLHTIFRKVAEAAYVERLMAGQRRKSFTLRELEATPVGVVAAIAGELHRELPAGFKPGRPTVRLSKYSSAYQPWQARANELILEHRETALELALDHAHALSGVDRAELARWPQIHIVLDQLIRLAEQRSAA